MSYLIYVLISFIVAIVLLEQEVHKTPLGLIGNALARCNIIERLLFYMMPFASDIYILLLYIERKYPEQLPKINWKAYPKHSVF